MKVREGGRGRTIVIWEPLPPRVPQVKHGTTREAIDSRQSTHGLLMLLRPKKWPTFEFVKLTLSKNEIERWREEQPHS